MELPDIGKHCGLQSCNSLDFLPISCNLCKGVFCKVHASYDGHRCPSWSPHHTTTSSKTFEGAKYDCDFCQLKEKVQIVCPKCSKNFCMAHRLEKDHNCNYVPPAYMPKTAELVKNITAKGSPRPTKLIKNQKTAAKVQLMKIKMNAVGNKSIPSTDRIFFKAVSSKGTKHVFVSKCWSLGKTLDSIADICGVSTTRRNEGDKKLSLFRGCDGQLINGGILDVSLEDLIAKDEVFSGETVILQHATVDQTSIDVSSL